ncbi:cellulase family glycosylhydrolase [Jonesiaceae bacterium BS-20]|uniref:Cellulase family glycosylhydrolase n=1 Tax=Jonesiaceae bacterium BS-20 TaxID=3120821 RepID=A0AAU7DTX0_9MICO
MRFYTDGTVLRDEHGRERIFHGINLVAKGNHLLQGNFIERGFQGTWTPQDIAGLAAKGFTMIRLGIMWAAVEPLPGTYDEEYLDWIVNQMDLIHQAGMVVLLDSHQDLYSQSFGDGAPAWATLTEQEFAATDMWSDAYLMSPAVHEALDAFWANAPGPHGVGLQDRFAAMWAHVANRVCNHPGLFGYDLLNEPAPGSPSPEIFASLIGAFAHATGQDPEQVFADFSEPEAKFAQLARLEDVAVYHQVGDTIHPLIAAFETDVVAPFMEKVARSIRVHDRDSIIAREHSYFANMGVPSGQPALPDPAWVYSPHGYDLTVDSEAIALSSNVRAGVIFDRHAQTQQRLGVPVLVGEWGALSTGPGVGPHGEFLMDFFDAQGWSWTYWCWEPGYEGSEAAAVMNRPRPIAFAGDTTSWRVTNGQLEAQWQGRDGAEPSVFFVPQLTSGAQVEVTTAGVSIPAKIDGPWVYVPAGTGAYELRSR